MTTQSWPPGAVLANRYQILRPLGRGGMGTLYLARDLRFERRNVALKENGARSPAAQTQFRLEAEVLATLQHPHLPAVTDYFSTPDGRQFLVMDYVEGENLEERVAREGSVPEALALAWAGQILDALAYLHAQSPPVIHRDVKPQNVIIRPDGGALPLIGESGRGAVLVDFGVAKYMAPGQPTATVARAGSPGYAPIEQYAGGTDQRSDIYSLGATLYFVLTGSVPPESPLLMSGQTLPHPRQLNPAISRCTEMVVLRAMQSEASSRFQSAAEMRAALQGKAILAPAGGKLLNDFRKMSRQQKTILFLLAALVMVVLCALVVLGWQRHNKSDGTPLPTVAPPTTATVEIVPTATPVPGDESVPVTPTEATVAPAGRATSTLVPTSTPTPNPTRRPPRPTDTPTPTAMPPQPPPQPQPTTEPPPSRPTSPPTAMPPQPPPQPTTEPPPPSRPTSPLPLPPPPP